MHVGIITMFYHSSNYGGVLQSYALIKAMEKLGMDAEQICYNHYSAFSWKKRLKRRMKQCLSLMKHPSCLRTYLRMNRRQNTVVYASENIIKHSSKVYTERTIMDCVNDYDAFVTGSDQVWHGEWPAYFLTFVPSSKRKISYAASTGKTKLTGDDIRFICNCTKDYKAVSVRESDTAVQLQEAMPDKKVELVLDPTLLLDKEDWDTVASDRLLNQPYVFCYFLGNDQRMRSLSSEYAIKHGYTLVTIPHMQQKVEINDLHFGDIQVFDAAPQDFLSYIKYAEVIFTDSFHASVFSQIFRRQYYVFGRLEHQEMNNRIITLTDMFESRPHFIEKINQYRLDYLENLPAIDYERCCNKYERMREKSIDFLRRNLT